ncbi:YcnI family protein [Peribacillus loiseleuriae]|uniref:Nuclear export factor GLE1 n=1 Tax=Peribacillus loiseleuriae TaxID=1679170 RepID=A0A0K9GU18_9BACI|nr:YcnI family protein [Peribacillus loiseleuriae]KMY50140.1 nuclear export factor GLE1 [Peribacillus loiseleuriae]
MKKLLTITVSMIGAIFLFSGVASAHVTVQPKETSQGKYEVFTVRVPSENEVVPTTKIEVKFPDEVDITRFEPKPGWVYEVQKDDAGKIMSVTWITEGVGLSPTDFGQFNMQGKVAEDATEIVWKAYQTYKDGSVVEWVGAPDAEKPASVTVVNPTDGSAQKHGHGEVSTDSTSNKQGAAKEDTTEEETKSSSSNAPIFLSIAALIVGLLSLTISFKKRS